MQKLLVLRCVVGVLFCATSQVQSDEPLDERKLPDNVTVRLVAARRSEVRTVHLIAKFETMDKDKREIFLTFHSYVATPHERMLMNLIEGCVGGCGPGSGPKWLPALAEAKFSIPKDGVDASQNRKDFEKCYLTLLVLPKDK